MSNATVYFVVAVGGVLSLTVCFVQAKRRRPKDYREYLAPALSQHGLQFVSARYPGLFRVGPFPMVEPRASRRLRGDFGSFVEYRVVSCADGAGRQFDVWAQLDFVAYVLQRLRWRTEPGSAIPDSAKALLES
jgi:hypothetical protein